MSYFELDVDLMVSLDFSYMGSIEILIWNWRGGVLDHILCNSDPLTWRQVFLLSIYLIKLNIFNFIIGCLLYTSPSPRDRTRSRMPSSA